MPTNAQILNIKVDQYNKILEILAEPKTIAQMQEALGFSKALIQYYMERLLANSYKTGAPMVLRFKSTMHRTAKNIPMYAYKRTVESITLNDLVDPVFIEQAKYALEAQNKRNNLSKLVTNTGEEKVSHIRIINLLSDPTKEQIKTLQAADEARREDNRKKKHRVNIGGSYSMMGYA
jgi:hypothetical protein